MSTTGRVKNPESAASIQKQLTAFEEGVDFTQVNAHGKLVTKKIKKEKTPEEIIDKNASGLLKKSEAQTLDMHVNLWLQFTSMLQLGFGVVGWPRIDGVASKMDAAANELKGVKLSNELAWGLYEQQ